MRALVVVSYGSSDLVAENLSSWTGGAAEGWRVVVVDNATTADERRRMTGLAQASGWTLVAPDANLGFGGGCAAGVAAAGDVTSILLLNPDAHVDVATADALAGRVEADTRLMLAPRILDSTGRPGFSGARLDVRSGRSRAWSTSGGVPWLTGACLALGSEAWHRLGGIAHEYFLYWEDVDLGWRWDAAGGRSEIAEDLRCVHDPGGTQRGRTASRAKSPTYYYYDTRNRLVFARRHLPRRDRARWALHAPGYAWSCLMRGGRRQLLDPAATLWPALRGTLAGLVALVGPARSSHAGEGGVGVGRGPKGRAHPS
ncbi:glycosyltransferase family 2 protein [Sanguibacter sp. HDW7]|uniref:glycosyltransferase family 2 protein n=1 Tax=Sanguibacter sp. HDW7 TaxID=2714931 RepID=UPI00140C2AC9|nr:glycosyltransferase [Sanguibacter sp. HDW7]QIK84196.1 glycosyltransferase family 2 protein [Sanguibacter sp. HDW7]